MKKSAIELHSHVPPDYYERSIKKNPLQRFWHYQRFAEVGEVVEKPSGEILDIGSADGTFTKVIADKSQARSVIGIDILESSVAYAKKRFAKSDNLKFLVADAVKLPFGDNRFEAVFCLEALEHIIDPHKAILEIKRVLKKGGYLVILVPTDSFLFKILWWIVLHTWGKHWRETHLNSFRQKNFLPQNLEAVGFRVEEDCKFLLNMLELVKARKV